MTDWIDNPEPRILRRTGSPDTFDLKAIAERLEAVDGYIDVDSHGLLEDWMDAVESVLAAAGLVEDSAPQA